MTFDTPKELISALKEVKISTAAIARDCDQMVLEVTKDGGMNRGIKFYASLMDRKRVELKEQVKRVLVDVAALKEVFLGLVLYSRGLTTLTVL